MSQQNWLVFVGTYTEGRESTGIYSYKFDANTGSLQATGGVAEVVNPSFLALDPTNRCLYAIAEVDEFDGIPGGAVFAYSVEPSTGALSLINHQSSVGTGPCHIVVEDSGRYVLVANYGGGSVSMLPIAKNGGLEPASDFVQHEGSSVDRNRQQGPHAHSIFSAPENLHAYAPDLELDKVLVYEMDLSEGKLRVSENYGAVTPGSGPRHFDFHPNGRQAYVINEMGNTITVNDYDSKDGKLVEKQTISTLPDDFSGTSHTADVHVTTSGKFLYGSNRGHDSLAMFQVDADSGKLEFIGTESTGGKNPRNFAIDPSDTFVLAANQDSDNIVTLRIDPMSGALTPTGSVCQAPTPVCLKFMPV